MAKQSKHRLKGKIITIRRGLAIYQTYASPYYQARIRDARANKYVVRSTQETSRIEARKVAEELAKALVGDNAPAPKEFSFRTYARRFVENARRMASTGERNPNYVRTITLCLDNDEWGVIQHFGDRDVRGLRTRDWRLFIEGIARRRPDLSTSTRNSLMAAFRNVLRVARDDGVIDNVPATPRVRQRDNPRAYFRFDPQLDEWSKLKQGAKELADQGVKVRGVEITRELYDLMLFCVHSFVRPTTTELYALRHTDVVFDPDPKRLILTIRKGKTGFRVSDTMGAAVAPFRRLELRYPDATGEDHIFMPHYTNRATAARVFARQFNHLLKYTGLKHDVQTNSERSVYCLRHTAICMRIALSGGIDLHVLARNAGTSVDQIERFYAKRLSMSPDMVRELQKYAVKAKADE